VIATANPQPRIASFRFTPLSGRAAVASRMRLARTQDVIGLAEMSDGRFLMTRRAVKVTIGGCGG
jgi:sulfur-oxidizing protein SoxY